MSATVLDTCAFCPRLCRHVCPASAATAREAATPTAIVSVVRLAGAGKLDALLAEGALELCNGCGACTRYCALHLDVAAFVREYRAAPPMADLPLLPPLHDGVEVFVEMSAVPGTPPHGPANARRSVLPDRTVHTPDALGHAAWKAGDLHALRRVSAHFGARRVLTSSFAITELLQAAGVAVTHLTTPPSPARFITCWEEATGTDGQVACCGAREGFEVLNLPVASAMAAEATRRMSGLPHTCADGHCAAWLRAHGADVRGPDAHQPS